MRKYHSRNTVFNKVIIMDVFKVNLSSISMLKVLSRKLDGQRSVDRACFLFVCFSIQKRNLVSVSHI